MTPEQVRQAFLESLGQIAPEGDLDHLRPDRPLRDQLDIDSYDFLQLVIALHERLGIDIPEADYQRLVTLQGALDYLNAALAAIRS
jgi:acyl carrier protein